MGGVSSSAVNPTCSNNSNLPPSSLTPSNWHNRNSDIPEDQKSKKAVDSLVATKIPESSNQSKSLSDVNGNEGHKEEGECGFCLFMKGGGCKDSFVAWEHCLKEAEDGNKGDVEKCHEVTANLMKCMQAHADYYGPILRAEKATKAESVKELEKETEAKESEANSGEKEAVIVVDSED